MDNNILTPNIEPNEKESNVEIDQNKDKQNENNPNEEQIIIPDWDLTPPFETIDRSEL